MIDFKSIKDGVKYLLEEFPKTRKSDHLLYVAYVNVILKDGFTAEKFVSGNFPPFESIRRVRQKLQQENPELKDKLTKIRRTVMQFEYEYEFAK